jgi:N-acetylglucosaminyl-diphospho-decaprenol L-rhamnosyltransferase
MPPQMSVSVIANNFNGERFLPRLLSSLRAQRGVTLEIIVVDRHSKDKSLEILSQQSDISVVHAPPELGLVAGYAAGVPKAACENLFFCNEDMWFDPHCLYSLERQISRERRIGIADPWEWDYHGAKVLHMGTRVKRKWDPGSVLPTWKFEQSPHIASGELTALACAGAMMIDRSVYEEIGGWDTSFFLDFEDADLCIRAWQRGWYCVTVPEARVFHAVGMSNSHILPAVRTTVGRRRYVWGSSNCIVVAAKYFRWRSVLLAVLARIDRFLRNLIKLRFELALLDLESLWLSVKRLPQTLQFRRFNQVWSDKRPGEDFFLDPAFRPRATGIRDEVEVKHTR